MRVIGGDLRGRRLQTPRGVDTRPTADRVRESLFNVLAPVIWDAAVLDLFAGSGALGIEALSRGASRAVFAEVDRTALRVLQRNLETLGLLDRAEVHQMPADRALRQAIAAGAQFDLVFLDPPYGRDLASPILRAIAAEPLLAAGAQVIVEHEQRAALSDQIGTGPGCLARFRVLTYGDTAISLYSQPENQRPEYGQPDSAAR